MKRKQMIIWVAASFLTPILLSVIFALSVNLLHIQHFAELWRYPFLNSLLILFPVFSCFLFVKRLEKWVHEVSYQKESGLVQSSLQRILYECIILSSISFLLLAFLLSYQLFARKEDILYIFFICTGVMMTTYAPFYFGIIVLMNRHLYRNGFPVQLEQASWRQSAVIPVILALFGVFITTTLFVYMISKTIGTAITLYAVLQRALVVSVIIGVPLVMLIFMIRQFYFQQLQHKQKQLRSLHFLLEKLYSNLELNDRFLEDVVETVGHVIGAKYAALAIFSEEGTVQRFITSGWRHKDFSYPEGKGVLGMLQKKEGCIRLSSVNDHPASSGFPSWHPKMDSFLGVPIMIGERTVGSFYITEKIGAMQFTKEDEELVTSFSRAFAVALQNSYYIEELKKKKKTAQEAANLKSQILSTMSHELRTPLHAIIGYSDILLDVLQESISEKQRMNLERIKESGRHLLGVINDILDLSKMEAGQMKPSIAPVYLRTLLQFCMYNAESLRGNKPIEIRLEGDAEIWLQSDEQKVKQIMMNLLSNAIKFTEQGEVVIRVKKMEKDVCLSVEDTGIGILPEHQALIFHPFKQIDGSLARKYKGTGLGLSIVERLVSLLNGTIQVESEFGKGSCFTVRLMNVIDHSIEKGKNREEVQEG
jgi:signal transduction histidine kinase